VTDDAQAAPQLDGRVLRGERNREKIIAALLELIREGNPRPTAEQVAERAGVGARTVFRHFDDMESLFVETTARVERELEPQLESALDGSLEERVRRVVRDRAALFERIAPFKRSGNLQRHRSAFLQERHVKMARSLRAHLRTVLPELESAPAAVAEALELVTSFEAWDRLRSDQRLGRERAAAAVEAAALAPASELAGPL
jgi:AcrR family transcriptional regulator